MTLGDLALDKLTEDVNNTIKWMERQYKTNNIEELERVMTPKDWEIYSLLNHIECELHI